MKGSKDGYTHILLSVIGDGVWELAYHWSTDDDFDLANKTILLGRRDNLSVAKAEELIEYLREQGLLMRIPGPDAVARDDKRQRKRVRLDDAPAPDNDKPKRRERIRL